MNAKTFRLGSFAVLLVVLGWASRLPAQGKGFEDLVPSSEIAAAVLKLDPAALAVVAAKTAAAEKVVGQPRPGLNAAQLYEAAIRVAGERRSIPVLNKLAADPIVKADPRLMALTRLVGGSRPADPEMTAALEEPRASPAQFARFRGYLMQIHDCKALADHDQLTKLTEHISGTDGLNDPQKKYLSKLIGKTRAAMPEKPSAAVQAVKQAREEAAKQVKAEVTEPAPKPDETPAPKGNNGPVLPQLNKDSSALVDDGFDKIDLAKIGAAWGRGDAQTVIDFAFKMAKEEMDLGRPHKHVPAKVLFQAGLGLAIANGDQATIARIEKVLSSEKAPDFEGKDAFMAKLTASRTLVASSRKGPQPTLPPTEDTAPESYQVYQVYLDRILLAGKKQDPAMVAALSEGLDAVIELTDAQRASLVQIAAEALKTAPGKLNAPASVLQTLAGDTEALGLSPVNREVLKFCRGRVGQKVDTGESATLALRAFDHAKAKPPLETPTGAIWGPVVKPAEAKPGDVVQFRNAVLSFEFPDGSAREWGYPSHTAVIFAVEGPGRFTVLHQDVGAPGKASEKRKVVQIGYVDTANLKKGTILIYRPQSR